MFSKFTVVSCLGLAASIAANPVPNTRPECTYAVLTLNQINYSSEMIYSTPAHLAVSDGTVSFDLINSELPYVVQCSQTSSQSPGFFYGNQEYTCPMPSGASPGDAVSFTYNAADGTFNVNQTWSCGTAYV